MTSRCISPARPPRSAAPTPWRDGSTRPCAPRARGPPRRIDRVAYGHALVVATLAEAKLLADDVKDAARVADRAIALSRQHGQRGWEAWTLRVQGEISSRCDPPDIDAATAHFRAAMVLAEERGMRPLQAHCRLGLGTVHRRAGEAERALKEIEAALDEYRAMDMPYWRARAEADLARLD